MSAARRLTFHIIIPLASDGATKQILVAGTPPCGWVEPVRGGIASSQTRDCARQPRAPAAPPIRTFPCGQVTGSMLPCSIDASVSKARSITGDCGRLPRIKAVQLYYRIVMVSDRE